MRERRAVFGTLLALLVCAGCGNDEQSTIHEATTTEATSSASVDRTKHVVAARRAVHCLEASGLAGVHERGAGAWSGNHEAPTYTIVVRELNKPAKTPRVVAGEYAISGSFKVVALGSGFVGDEGIQADALVQTVADCLAR